MAKDWVAGSATALAKDWAAGSEAVGFEAEAGEAVEGSVGLEAAGSAGSEAVGFEAEAGEAAADSTGPEAPDSVVEVGPVGTPPR